MKTLTHIIAFIFTMSGCLSWWYTDAGMFGYPVILLCYLCIIGAINDYFMNKELYK